MLDQIVDAEDFTSLAPVNFKSEVKIVPQYSEEGLEALLNSLDTMKKVGASISTGLLITYILLNKSIGQFNKLMQ